MSFDKVRTSKFMSLLLRHEPQAAGITLDSAGWVAVEQLLQGMAAAGKSITREQLLDVVATSPKQRFELSADNQRIRARQGHSVEVDLAYEPVKPPDVLYHGTAAHNLGAILRDGLSRMQRHHVHMSTDKKLMLEVGQRHGKPVLLRIDARQMHDHGHVFFVTANHVYLTEHVLPHYLSVDDAGV